MIAATMRAVDSTRRSDLSDIRNNFPVRVG
jgi:hypothetical protein